VRRPRACQRHVHAVRDRRAQVGRHRHQRVSGRDLLSGALVAVEEDVVGHALPRAHRHILKHRVQLLGRMGSSGYTAL